MTAILFAALCCNKAFVIYSRNSIGFSYVKLFFNWLIILSKIKQAFFTRISIKRQESNITRMIHTQIFTALNTINKKNCLQCCTY